MDKTAVYERYFELLVEANKKFNLTAIVERDAVFSLHFKDSAAAAHLLFPGARVLDIGSGAGFPGMVLAIERPDCEFVLMEATGKKCVFLQQTATVLGLNNVQVVHARAELLRAGNMTAGRQRGAAPLANLLGKTGNGITERAGNNVAAGLADFVVSRAVGALPLLIKWGFPYLKSGGELIAWKTDGREVEDCAKILQKLGGKILAVEKYSLADRDRVLIRVSRQV